MNLEVAELLEKAADLFESEQANWCQNVIGSDAYGQLNLCAVGAIYRAGGLVIFVGDTNKWNQLTPEEREFRGQVVIAAEREVSLRLPGNEKTVPGWNDHEAQSKQDVIDLFKETAKELRNESMP